MRRRDFITLLGGAAAAWPLAARAQQPRMPVIGYLSGRSAESDAAMLAALRRGLGEGGYIEGQNIAIEYRFSDGQYDRLPALMTELTGRQVSVLVVAGVAGTVSGQMRASQIPIVFNVGGDPVRAGLVASMNRPGGNITGIFTDPVLPGKDFGLLHELVPDAKTVAVLVDASFTDSLWLTEAREAAATLGVQLRVLVAGSDSELDSAFATLNRERADAMVVTTSPFFVSRAKQIVALVARYRVHSPGGSRAPWATARGAAARRHDCGFRHARDALRQLNPATKCRCFQASSSPLSKPFPSAAATNALPALKPVSITMLMKTNFDAVITNDQRAHMAKYVRKTIGKIAKTKFKKDPLVVEDLSRSASEISSAYKRHGFVLEEALRTALKTRADLRAWTEKIAVPGQRKKIQTDLLTYQAATGTLAAYEVKRSLINLDDQAADRVEERLTALLPELPNYALSKKLSVTVCKVAAVGYYDLKSTRIGAHAVIASPDLSTEFGTLAMKFIEDVNDYFRHCLLRRQAPHLVGALQQMAGLPAFREAVGPADAASSPIAFIPLEAATHPWDAL
jgi:putative ABC transport system substrate-binding protein